MTENAVVKVDQLPVAYERPADVVSRATEQAKVLQDIVKQAGLARRLGGKKEHLEFEAWQTLGRFYNYTPVTEWTKPIWHAEKIVGWEARVNIIDRNGQIVAAAENMCAKDEVNWKDKPQYALRSMAQTRAAGKAFRSVLAFVAVLAGYSPTPIEEMDGIEIHSEPKQSPKNVTPKEPDQPGTMTQAQRKKLFAMCKEAKMDEAQIKSFGNFLKRELGDPLTVAAASQIFDDWDGWLDKFSIVEKEITEAEQKEGAE